LFEEGETLAHAKHDNRESTAHDRAAALESRIPLLRVEGEGASSASVEVDGERGDWSSLHPIDPGKHLVRAPHFEKLIDAPQLKTEVVVTIPAIEQPLPPAKKALFWTPLRITSAAIVGAGALSLMISLGAGADAISKKNASNDAGHCDSAQHCDAIGLGLRNGAETSATVSTVTFFMSLGLVALGAVLFVLAPTIAPQRAEYPAAFRF